MARGGQHRGRGRKRKQSRKVYDSLSKKQKNHYREFGEAHPADERETYPQKYRKVNDEHEKEQHRTIPAQVTRSSSEDEAEEASAYQQLLSTFGDKADPKSDSESEAAAAGDEDDDEDDDELSEDEDEDDSDAESNGQPEPLTRDDDPNDAGSPSEDGEEDDVDEDGTLEPISSGPLAADDKEGGYSDEEDEEEEETTDSASTMEDPFAKHFEVNIPDTKADELSKSSSWEKSEVQIPMLGKYVKNHPKNMPEVNVDYKEKNLRKLHVKQVLCNHAVAVNKKLAKAELKLNERLTSYQHSLFSVMNSYKDISISDRTMKTAEETRFCYCLHAVNHVLKTRSRVIAHNNKLKVKDHNDEYRDQGLTRPKVLIVAPFRDAALRIVNIISHLLMDNEQSFVSNKKRFQQEFTTDTEHTGARPEDYEEIFAGNIDDHFRIGLGVTKKSLKLYSPFYMSDIIIASPLGLRTVIGAEGEKDRDFDFLSSIEVLIFDQMDVYMMQNWDHILHVMQHLNLQPSQSHGVDFSRVRMWSLDGWSKFYRQTLIFSSVALPEINSILNKHCHNYAGKLQQVHDVPNGSICQIVAQLPQVFHRIPVTKYSEAPDARFEFFKNKILPEYRDKAMAQTLIFIPSYFDFVRIRNLFRKEEISFQKLCEYTVDKSIVRARSFFFHGRTHFLLFTERLHFYRRLRIRGIKHLIFYDLPTYGNYYSEIANMTLDPKKKYEGHNFTCEVLYTKYDVHKLGAIVGTGRAAQMINSDKHVHMFTTGDS